MLFAVIKMIDKSAVFLPDNEPSFNEVTIIGTALIIVIVLGIRKIGELKANLRT
jgi:hypothetical protein